MSKQPLVSIITPAFNAERFIVETISSVQNQIYQNWEQLIVLDKNSKDRTGDLVAKIAATDPRVKLIRPTGVSGAAENRNIGLEKATGELIAFLDADDLWFPEKLSRQVQFMEKEKINFSYHAYFRISEDGSEIGALLPAKKEMRYQDLLKNNTIGCLSVMLRKTPFIGQLSFLNYGWEDMGLWLKLLKNGEVAKGIQEPLAYYRIVKGSRSNNKLFAAKLRWETYRKVEKMSLPSSVYNFLLYMSSSLLKYSRF